MNWKGRGLLPGESALELLSVRRCDGLSFLLLKGVSRCGQEPVRLAGARGVYLDTRGQLHILFIRLPFRFDTGSHHIILTVTM